MGGDEEIRRPVGAEHEEPRRLGPPRDHREPFHRGRIGPVQVFEQQHHRLHARQDLQRFAQLAQHPLAGDAAARAPERLEIRGGTKAGSCASQLGAWRRRISSTRSPPGCRHNRLDRFEQRQERLPGAVVLDHWPRRDEERPVLRGWPGRPRRSAVLPIPASPVTNAICRRPSSARVSRSSSRAISSSRPITWLAVRAHPASHNTGRGAGASTSAAGAAPTWRDEPIPDAVHGLDVARLPRIVPSAPDAGPGSESRARPRRRRSRPRPHRGARPS